MALDVVVCGLGVMGSAALLALARRGVKALGIERFAPGHDRGSSHGRTRIIRLSYVEDPSYVPLLRRAYALWRELEAAAGERLLHITGIVEIGPGDGELVQATLACASLHGLPHEVLPPPDFMRRFPAFRLPPDYVGVVQPDGGFLAAEASVQAMARLAQTSGAHIRAGERVCAIEPAGRGVRVVTDRAIVAAGAAIVTAGPWTKALLPDLPAPLRVTRQVMGWFEPREPALVAPGRFPVFLIENPHGMHYGFPDIGAGVKVAKHYHHDEQVDPDSYDRSLSAADEQVIRAAVAEFLPAANGRLLDTRTCLYTMMPDGDFLIDRLPDTPQVIVASPCSGHGFKFAPVIGEILADLAIDGMTTHNIARFRLARPIGGLAGYSHLA